MNNELGTIKILHFADLHLGMENYGKIDPKTCLNSRLFDFLAGLDKVVKASKKAHLVLFAGDAYKTREPSQTYQREFASRIKKMAENCPVVLVVGNHDTPVASAKANTLDIFKALGVKNVYISNKPEILNLKVKSGEKIQVATLPWLTKNELLNENEKTKSIEETTRKATEKLIKIVKDFDESLDPDIPSILLAHASVSGAVFGSEQSIMLGSDLILPKSVLEDSHFDYVGLGHLHKHQVLSKSPPIIYSGSIERIDFSESREEKGFVVVGISDKGQATRKFETEYEFIPLPARRFVQIEVILDKDEKEPTEKIISEIKKHDIKNAVVRVIIEAKKDTALKVDETEIKNALKDANYIAGVHKEIVSEIRDSRVIFTEELSVLELLEKYLVAKKVKTEKIKLLKSKAQELIEEVNL